MKRALQYALLAVLIAAAPAGTLAQKRQPSLEDQALATMKKATQFMMDKVSYKGGFVWDYLPDFSRQWGEMEAKRTMIWNQPPGTPTVGHLLLDVYHATGDEYYYEAAKKVAEALMFSQLPCGGWNYCFDFAGEGSLKDWYATVGANGWRLEEFQHYYGNATFDDEGTAQSSKFLLRMYVEKLDPAFRPALDRAINLVLESQYPVGGWPQRYPLMYEFSHHGKPDYTSYITLNDEVIGENIDFLIKCYQAMGLQGVKEPIIRAMNCLYLLQQGAPQAGWGEQYTLDLKPIGARTYEPDAITPGPTIGAIYKMISYYRMTGETKFLRGIPAAIDWLESCAIPADQMALSGKPPTPEGSISVPTFVEIGTNKPRYIHRTGSNVVNGHYYFDQDIRNTPSHYSSIGTVNITRLRKDYENTLAIPADKVTAGSPLLETKMVPLPKYFSRGRHIANPAEREASARNLISSLNAEGYWPVPLEMTSNPYIGPGKKDEVTPGNYMSVNVGDKYDTSPYRDPDPKMGISCKAYVANMFELALLVESLKTAK